MEEIKCPYCEANLTEDIHEKLSRGEDIVKLTIGGTGNMITRDGMRSFQFGLITCPMCHKILSAVNTTPIPIPY